jgi:hypothetical protein
MRKTLLIAGTFAALALAGVYALSIPTTTHYTPEPEPAPPCHLDCLVAERANEIFERDQTIYRRQAELNALIEIQAELQLLTLEHGLK